MKKIKGGCRVATKDKGKKHTCQSCGAVFYDLKRKPITCPKCGTKVEAKSLLKPRRNVTQAAKPAEKAPDSDGDVETEAVARKSGVKVVIHKYEGDIEQKSFAVSQACHEWVLSLDADEEVGVELRGEIQNALENQRRDFPSVLGSVGWHHLTKIFLRA